MTLPISGNVIRIGQIFSEFGGSNSMSNYNRSGGLVASHWNNLSIPTTDVNLKMSNFYGSGVNYKTTITSETSGTLSGFLSGTMGSITAGTSQVGLSETATTGGSLLGYYITTVTPPKGGADTYTLRLKINGGDHTATTWSHVQCGSPATNNIFYRAGNTVSFVSPNTTWTWATLAVAPAVNGALFLAP